MLKSVLLAAFMFLAVLFGMQLASEGVGKMKGYDDANFKGAFSFEEGEEGELQASLLGNEVTSHDLEQKKAELEGMKTYNFFSSVGKKLADTVTAITDRTIQFITDLIN
jgi:hypothetical protein